MTKQEALILLGATEDNFEEVVMNSIFEHKQFLLKSVITPPVFKTRARKIATINEAFKFLRGESSVSPITLLSLDHLVLKDRSTDSLLTFYRAYENLMSQLKLKFMQNNDPFAVSNACDQLADLENKKLHEIASATEEIEISSLIEVKISEFVNSGEVIKELKIANNTLITTDNIISFPTFGKDISRSRKYVNFTNLKNKENA